MQSNPGPKRPPLSGSRQLTGFVIVFAIVVVLGLKGNTTTSPSPAPATPQQTTELAIVNVGDTVGLSFPTLTIICEDRNDASKVHLAGEIVMRSVANDALRVDRLDPGSAYKKGLKAGYDARKDAMRKAYSCRWGDRGERYDIMRKEITGTEKDLFHVASYCLQQDGWNVCRWIVVNADDKLFTAVK
jgi:hypothetical protein